jgi:hypothetical protein
LNKNKLKLKIENMKKYTSTLFAAVGLAAGLLIALPAFAQTSVSASVGVGAGGGYGGHGGMHGKMQPGVFGTVSAVDGTTLTVTNNGFPMRRNSTSTASATPATTYTVDASNATIYKGSATSTVSISSIAIGDMVMVQGTVNGTNVTATVIHDGFARPMGGPAMPGGGRGFGHPTSTTSTAQLPIQGNGEPVIAGAVTAVSGSSITVTNASNVTYTIDASSATLVKGGTTSTLASVAVGDELVVQGTVNGTSVTASSVIDQGAKMGNASSTTGAVSVRTNAGFGFGGIFSAIGGFFQHLFGF